MDGSEPDTPFAAVSAQTTKYGRILQSYLDASVPHTTYRWLGTSAIFLLFCLRIFFAQGWYIVAYSLGIYILNLFLAFISPKFDPSLDVDEDMEEGGSSSETVVGILSSSTGGERKSSLPTKATDEFKPFVRRLPEFKFWYSATRAVTIAFLACWTELTNLPVFWPVLVVYWLILVVLTMRRQIQHMLKYRYVPWDYGKQQFKTNK